MHTQKAGYTIIEIVVVLALMVILTGVALFRFSSLNENVALNNTAREIMLDLRRTQNAALAVKEVDISGTPQIPERVGMHLDIAQNDRYFLFADINNDRQYNAGEKIGTDVLLKRDTTLQSLTSPILDIIFFSPEATPVFYNGAGGNVGSQADIIIVSPSGLRTKQITVRISGQIEFN